MPPNVCATVLTSSEPGLVPDEGTGADKETKAWSTGRAQVHSPWESYTSVGFTGHTGRQLAIRWNMHFAVMKDCCKVHADTDFPAVQVCRTRKDLKIQESWLGSGELGSG